MTASSRERRARGPLLGLLLAAPEAPRGNGGGRARRTPRRSSVVGPRGREHDVARARLRARSAPTGRGGSSSRGPRAPTGVLDQRPEMPLDERGRAPRARRRGKPRDERLDGVREHATTRCARGSRTSSRRRGTPGARAAVRSRRGSCGSRCAPAPWSAGLPRSRGARRRACGSRSRRGSRRRGTRGARCSCRRELRRRVGQRGEQEVAVREPVPEPFLAPLERGGIERRDGRRSWLLVPRIEEAAVDPLRVSVGHAGDVVRGGPVHAVGLRELAEPSAAGAAGRPRTPGRARRGTPSTGAASPRPVRACRSSEQQAAEPGLALRTSGESATTTGARPSHVLDRADAELLAAAARSPGAGRAPGS